MKPLTIRIIHAPDATDPFIVIYKPAGLPSAPLSVQDTNNAVGEAATLFPQLRSVTGRKTIEHGLVHRIDTDTKGLLLVATTQQAYDYFLRAQKSGFFIKKYRAACDLIFNNQMTTAGFPPISTAYRTNIIAGKKVIISSFFRPYEHGHAVVRPVTKQSGTAAQKKISGDNLYSTQIELDRDWIHEYSGKVPVICTITAGYRHQVRCHLAWIGLPISGDKLYNPYKNTNVQDFKFEAFSIEFPHPITGEKTIFTLQAP